MRYDPPLAPDKLPSIMATQAQALWSALDGSYGTPSGDALQGPYRLLAYRAAGGQRTLEALLANWRWKLRLWQAGDRQDFAMTMARAYQSLLDVNPALRTAKR